MKTNKIYLTAFVATLLLGACNEALEYKDVIYFTGTEASDIATLYVDGTAEAHISVTSSTKMEQDTEVYIEIDENALAAFGERMGAEYEMIPSTSYVFTDNVVVIEKGKNVSIPLVFEITNMDDFVEGINYCIPFRITGNSEGFATLEASQYQFMLISTIVETRAMNLANSWHITMEGMKGDPTLNNLAACTMELRIFANGYSSLSHKIASFIGVEENFLLRMGDVSVANNQVQLAGRGPSMTANTTTIQLGQWYHVAIVDNGSEMTMYINGNNEGSTSTTGLKAVNLGYYYNSSFSIGRSADDYRRFNGYVSEGRVWRRALTPIELQNNLCFVDVEKAEGLIGYWRCDSVEADGVTVPDISGNGYHGTASRTVSASDFVTIKCPVLE